MLDLQNFDMLLRDCYGGLLEPKFASAHQISLKSNDSTLTSENPFFKMAAVRHLEFSKLGTLVM